MNKIATLCLVGSLATARLLGHKESYDLEAARQANELTSDSEKSSGGFLGLFLNKDSEDDESMEGGYDLLAESDEDDGILLGDARMVQLDFDTVNHVNDLDAACQEKRLADQERELGPSYRTVGERHELNLSITQDQLFESISRAYDSWAIGQSVYHHKEKMVFKFDLDQDGEADIHLSLRFDWSPVLRPHISKLEKELLYERFIAFIKDDEDFPEYRMNFRIGRKPSFKNALGTTPSYCSDGMSEELYSELPRLNISEFALADLSPVGSEFLTGFTGDREMYGSIGTTDNIIELGPLNSSIGKSHIVFSTLEISEPIYCYTGNHSINLRVNLEYIANLTDDQKVRPGDRLLEYKPSLLREIVQNNMGGNLGIVECQEQTRAKLRRMNGNKLQSFIEYDKFLNRLDDDEVIDMINFEEISGTGTLNDLRKALLAAGADREVYVGPKNRVHIVLKPMDFMSQAGDKAKAKVEEFAFEFGKRLADAVAPGASQGIKLLKEAHDIYKQKEQYKSLLNGFGRELNHIIKDWQSGNSARFTLGLENFARNFGDIIAEKALWINEGAYITPADPVKYIGMEVDGRGNPLPPARMPVIAFLSSESITEEEADLGYISLAIGVEETEYINYRTISNTINAFQKLMKKNKDAHKIELVDIFDRFISEASSDLMDMLF